MLELAHGTMEGVTGCRAVDHIADASVPHIFRLGSELWVSLQHTVACAKYLEYFGLERICPVPLDYECVNEFRAAAGEFLTPHCPGRLCPPVLQLSPRVPCHRGIKEEFRGDSCFHNGGFCFGAKGHVACTREAFIGRLVPFFLCRVPWLHLVKHVCSQLPLMGYHFWICGLREQLRKPVPHSSTRAP